MTHLQSTPLPTDESEICEQYTPLVEGMVRRLHVPAVLRSDARQEGFIGLLDAVRRYDRTSPVHFAVFARTYVKGAILRRVYTTTQTTETPSVDPHAGQDSEHEIYEIEVEVLAAVQVEAWMASLPLAHAYILRRVYWHDATSDEIAAEIGVTRRRVNQIHTTLLRQGAVALDGEG